MDLSEYRQSERERARVESIFSLVPKHGTRALDIGTRDGFLAKRLADRFEQVVALDLDQPKFDYPRVLPVKGDVTRLDFPDRHFDFVLCVEVLEHIPPPLLQQACSEIARVAAGTVLIDVPYRQDLRFGRTTCQNCGRTNPPWGHQNSFDESALRTLFSGLEWTDVHYVGSSKARTNAISAALLDYAGNPFGTWVQEEPCVHCGGNIGHPTRRSALQRVATRLADLTNRTQGLLVSPRANWIHVQFSV